MRGGGELSRQAQSAGSQAGRLAGRARQDMSGLARMDKEISREGAEAGAGAGQRNAYNVALHIGTKEIENVEMAKRKWAVSSRKAATRGLRSKLQLSSERNRLRGCPGDCFAFFAFIDELSITKLYFRLLFFCFCLCSRAVCFLAFKDMTLNCSLAAWQPGN